MENAWKLFEKLFWYVADMVYIILVFFVLAYQMYIFWLFWDTSIRGLDILVFLLVLYLVRIALAKGMPSRLDEQDFFRGE